MHYPGQVLEQTVAVPSSREGGTEPLLVRRVAPIEYQRKAHDVPDQPRRRHRRTGFVTDFGGAGHKRLLLGGWARQRPSQTAPATRGTAPGAPAEQRRAMRAAIQHRAHDLRVKLPAQLSGWQERRFGHGTMSRVTAQLVQAAVH